MKELGTFTIDEIGRILIPAQLRNMLGWESGCELAMFYLDDNNAVLRLNTNKATANRLCDICNEGESLIMARGHKICKKCAKYITDLAKFQGIRSNK